MNMQKLLTATLVAMLIGFTAQAQFEIKPTAGINLSNVSTTPSGTKTSAKMGYQFGGSLMFGNRLYLSPGIYYFQQVTQFVISNPDGSTTAITSDAKTAGVKIPLLVGFKLIDPETDPMVNFRIFAGPSVNFNTKSKFSSGFGSDEIKWKKNTWGAQVGAGLDVSFFFVEAGYEFGLSSSYEGDSASQNFKDIKHNTFVLNVGARFVIQ